MQIRKLYKIGSKRSKSVVVVLPTEVLETVGVGSGDYVSIAAANGVISIEKVQTEPSPKDSAI